MDFPFWIYLLLAFILTLHFIFLFDLGGFSCFRDEPFAYTLKISLTLVLSFSLWPFTLCRDFNINMAKMNNPLKIVSGLGFV